MNPLRLLFLLIPLSLSAQEPEPTAVPIVPEAPTAIPGGGIRLRIFVTPIRGILTETTKLHAVPSLVTLETLQGPTSLKLRRNTYSQSVVVASTSTLRLYRRTPSGKKGALYVKADLPGNTDNAIALLNPAPSGDAEQPVLQVFSLPASQSPAGWHTFLNGLENEVELRIEDNIHNIGAGERVALDLGSGRTRVFIREHGGKQSRRYTGAVYPQDDRGILHLIGPAPDSARRIRLTTLYGPRLTAP